MRRHNGFSLTETLLAIGTLAVGMLFIGGTFLTGIHFTTIATERTIAAVAADEAFAKVRLYGLGVSDPNLAPGTAVPFTSLSAIAADEMMYPSADFDPAQKRYHWSALCRLVDPSSRLVQVTVFVSRRMGPARYWRRNIDDWPNLAQVTDPGPVLVMVNYDSSRPYELEIRDAGGAGPIDDFTLINDGYRIVATASGRVYRVLERYADTPDQLRLDVPFQESSGLNFIWVVPPPVNGGRNPCIALYQRVIRF